MTNDFDLLEFFDDIDRDLRHTLDSLVLQTLFHHVDDAFALDDEVPDDNEDDNDDGFIRPRAERSKRRCFDHKFCRCYVMEKVLGAQATIDFRLVYRISPQRFNMIHDAIRDAPNNDFFFNKRGVGVPPAARMLLPLQCLAFGVSATAFAHCYQMSPPLARTCCQEFDKVMCRLFLSEFMRSPTAEDLKRIDELHFDKHKVSGMLGSLDCMHLVWKNCPVAWQGMYQGKEKDPTMILEAVCDYNLWFWHGFFGAAGSQNDINVLKLSRLLHSFLSGDFELREREAGVVPYDINGEMYDEMFVLVDGIYPRYTRFVKGFKEAITDDKKKFSKWQEATRKDIERGFGVLQSQWKWTAYPVHCLNTKILSRRLKTCLILHNMNVSDRVMGGDVTARYNPSYGRTPPVRDVMALPPLRMKNRAQRWRDLMNVEKHNRLHNALLKKYGNDDEE